MPQVDLPTGVSLYYETHGQGDPLVLIPSTGFSAEAWKPSQMPLAKSSQLIIHDPRGCGRSIATQQVYTINQMANDVVALLDHLGSQERALCRSFHGRTYRLGTSAQFSRASEKLDHGRERFRSSRQAWS